MAGLACADALAERGLAVRLFDKGRGPGGRMSTRRMAVGGCTVAFDHGAQYVTARDPAFVAQMQRWEASGVAARWPAAGEDAWVGTPGMSAFVKAMAERHAVRWGCRVERIEHAADGWRLVGDELDEGGFDAVVIAVPAEQVAALADPHAPEIAAAARASHSEPCYTVMAAFNAPLPAPDILRAGDGLSEGSPLGWATRNSAKPGRDRQPEAWVLQATPDWSVAHLEEERDVITPALLTALSEALGTPLPSPTIATAHRWRYARADARDDGALWNEDQRIGACGDWLMGPRVESAWLSGRALRVRSRPSFDTQPYSCPPMLPLGCGLVM